MTNKIFFLGAGFSITLAKKCIINKKQYPPLKELTSKIIKKFCKTSLETYLNEISQKYKNNIEDLLTYLFEDLP